MTVCENFFSAIPPQISVFNLSYLFLKCANKLEKKNPPS
jgi:hypothetical protein